MLGGYSTYKTANVDTADQGKLILVAYDVAIKHCKLSLERFTPAAQAEERTRHLFRAQDAITELMSSLKLDVGEIARNLYRLYEYMLHRLVQSNIRNDAEGVREVLRYLEDLRDAWVQAIQKVRIENAGSGPQAQVQNNFAIVG